MWGEWGWGRGEGWRGYYTTTVNNRTSQVLDTNGNLQATVTTLADYSDTILLAAVSSLLPAVVLSTVAPS